MRKRFFAFFTGAMIAGAMAGQASASAATYSVQKGDTLWSISQKQGTTVEQLKSWNNLSGDVIVPNQQLHISADTAENKENKIDNTYIVKKGDSLWKISQKYGVSVNQLKAWNKLSSDIIYPGQRLSVAGGSTAASEAPAPAPAPQQTAPAPEAPAKASVQAQAAQGPAPTQAAPAKQTAAAPQGKELTVTATAYTASCNGCSGITATGINLKANPNQKVIAVDPSVIPLGSKVHVEGYGTAVAGDTGGAIKGNKIDVFVPSHSDAVNYGVKTVKVTVLN